MYTHVCGHPNDTKELKDFYSAWLLSQLKHLEKIAEFSQAQKIEHKFSQSFSIFDMFDFWVEYNSIEDVEY